MKINDNKPLNILKIDIFFISSNLLFFVTMNKYIKKLKNFHPN
jgi:hypothetical protein